MNNIVASPIHKRIKERRLELDMTLMDLSKKLGVQEATVQRYETGAIKNISHKTIILLTDILKCSPAYLLGLDDWVTIQKSEIHSDKIIEVLHE